MSSVTDTATEVQHALDASPFGRPSGSPTTSAARACDERVLGLHHHEANDGSVADESRTGVDHVTFGVARREDLDTWATWLDEQGVTHSGVIDATDPMRYSTVVFRDPDNIQLELAYMAG